MSVNFMRSFWIVRGALGLKHVEGSQRLHYQGTSLETPVSMNVRMVLDESEEV